MVFLRGEVASLWERIEGEGWTVGWKKIDRNQ